MKVPYELVPPEVWWQVHEKWHDAKKTGRGIGIDWRYSEPCAMCDWIDSINKGCLQCPITGMCNTILAIPDHLPTADWEKAVDEFNHLVDYWMDKRFGPARQPENAGGRS